MGTRDGWVLVQYGAVSGDCLLTRCLEPTLLPAPVPSVPGAALCLEHMAGQGSRWQGAVTWEGPAGTSCPPHPAAHPGQPRALRPPGWPSCATAPWPVGQGQSPLLLLGRSLSALAPVHWEGSSRSCCHLPSTRPSCLPPAALPATSCQPPPPVLPPRPLPVGAEGRRVRGAGCDLWLSRRLPSCGTSASPPCPWASASRLRCRWPWLSEWRGSSRCTAPGSWLLEVGTGAVDWDRLEPFPPGSSQCIQVPRVVHRDAVYVAQPTASSLIAGSRCAQSLPRSPVKWASRVISWQRDSEFCAKWRVRVCVCTVNRLHRMWLLTGSLVGCGAAWVCVLGLPPARCRTGITPAPASGACEM